MSFEKAFYLLDHRLIALAMVVLLVAAGEIGYRRGLFRRESNESVRSLMSGTGAAMLGLLGLLLGFTLAMAVSRWDERRDVIVDEANAIGTLWLRAGLLEAPLRDEMRDVLQKYTDARISLGGSRDDRTALRAAQNESELLHATIWAVVERADQPGRSNAVLIAGLLTCVILSACTVGPASLHRDYPRYSQTLRDIQDEHLLLNLVHLRYLETPVFLQLTSITTTCYETECNTKRAKNI